MRAEQVLITDAEVFFAQGCGRCVRFATPDCSVQQWAGGLQQLRQICLDCGLEETVKWGHPCYMHAGRNIALLGAFRGNFRLNFFNAALLNDPEGVLEKQGPNSRHAGMIRFTELAGVGALEAVIRRYLTESMVYARAGLKPANEPREIELPDELVDAMDCDPELAEAFCMLTPGRQRSYVINLNAAKKSETRMARIAKFRARILAGKGAMER
tara:strand:+ start:47 stop:685 length:639 start_codon:yes stop_codon:yes gene_type:complete